MEKKGRRGTEAKETNQRNYGKKKQLQNTPKRRQKQTNKTRIKQ